MNGLSKGGWPCLAVHARVERYTRIGIKASTELSLPSVVSFRLFAMRLSLASLAVNLLYVQGLDVIRNTGNLEIMNAQVSPDGFTRS